ncbi:MAG: PDZ domain-containing protein [Acidobacteriia bacterium]|nr:PDZ domain-containing protein [Terriglobia bacterium]
MLKQVTAELLLLALMFCTAAKTAMADDLSNERDKMKMILNVVSKEVAKNFYDADMKGLDWKALTDQAKQKIEKAQSVTDMMRAIFILVEKLRDSHTRFLPPSRNISYRFGFNAKPIGDEIHVYEVKEKGAAEAAGIKVGDRILAVNGFRADRSLYDLMMWDFKVVCNAPFLELKIQTDEEAPRTIHLEAKKKVEPVVLDFRGDRGDIWDLIREWGSDQPGWHYRAFKDGIGYAQIRAFDYESEDFFVGLIDKADAKRAVVLDLRSNGGGAVDTLKAFAGNFESDQVVMGDIKGRKKDEQLVIKRRRPHYDMPMYILIDSETGSAAEMFARHFQLRKKAVIVGDRSSGRVTRSIYYSEEIGTDQIVPFGVQVGMGRIVFPDGGELEKNGVTPDVSCVPSGKEMREERDVCLWKAVAMAREKLGLPPDASVMEGKPSDVTH